MASLKQISAKINSAKGTRRMLSAMKLIAAVKLQRAQSLLKSHRVYVDAYGKVAAVVLNSCEPDMHPLLFRPREKKRAHIVFLTSDRGLCGNFNSVLVKGLDSVLNERNFDGEDLKITFLGNKGRDHFSSYGFSQGIYHTGVNEDNCAEIADELASAVSGEFAERRTDEVIVVHSSFVSALSRKTVFETVLPLEIPPVDGDGAGDCLFEPSKEKMLDELVPGYLKLRFERAMLESLASEHAARMTAMESATNNTDELIKNLTLSFNKKRQAIITTELMDIVNGTEALRQGGDD